MFRIRIICTSLNILPMTVCFLRVNRIGTVVLYNTTLGTKLVTYSYGMRTFKWMPIPRSMSFR